MKKILIISNSDAGLYEFRKEVVSALIETGYEVHISVPETGFKDRLAMLGATIHVTALDRRGMNPATDYKLYKAYKALLKELKPDVALTYTIKPNVYGGVACKKAKVAYLANVTGLGSTLQGDGILKKFIVMLYRIGLKGASCVFFQNAYNMEFMKNCGCVSQKTHTRLLSGSGVNLEEHALLPYPKIELSCENTFAERSGDTQPDDKQLTDTISKDNRIHLLNIGRIMDDKGSSELLTAVEKIRETHPEVVLDILGTFEEETKDKYEPWVNRLVESGAVFFHGFRDDVDNFYKVCHVVIHPSYHEGMSNVVQEAAAAGRPVLTSDIPGCNEIYENGIGGIAFEPRSMESLLEAMETFLSMSEADREKMGIAAREYVEKHFDRKLVVEAYLEEIAKVV